MTRVALAAATVLGVGYVPFAPGTFGSLVGLAFWWVLPAAPSAQAAAIIALFIVGSWSGGVAERYLGTTDPSVVVIDEVMGMLITLFLNPVGWLGAFAAFLLFRVFDVIKPFPAGSSQRLRGGVGVMIDDVIAGFYALVVQALARMLIGAS